MSNNFHTESLKRMPLNEDDLLVQLGTDLVGPGAMPLKPSELADRARRWLLAQQEFLEAHICTNESIKQFALATTDDSAIAVELAKLLAGLLLPVNPVTLAVLLIKRGLKSFCSTRWGTP